LTFLECWYDPDMPLIKCLNIKDLSCFNLYSVFYSFVIEVLFQHEELKDYKAMSEQHFLLK